MRIIALFSGSRRHHSASASTTFSSSSIPQRYRSLSLADLPGSLLQGVRIRAVPLDLLATSIKRLHDRDKSAWWMVPFFVLPGLYNHVLGPAARIRTSR